MTTTDTTLSTCLGVTLCPEAAELWAKVKLAETTGTYSEYQAAWRAYWEHTCNTGRQA